MSGSRSPRNSHGHCWDHCSARSHTGALALLSAVLDQPRDDNQHADGYHVDVIHFVPDPEHAPSCVLRIHIPTWITQHTRILSLAVAHVGHLCGSPKAFPSRVDEFADARLYRGLYLARDCAFASAAFDAFHFLSFCPDPGTLSLDGPARIRPASGFSAVSDGACCSALIFFLDTVISFAKCNRHFLLAHPFFTSFFCNFWAALSFFSFESNRVVSGNLLALLFLPDFLFSVHIGFYSSLFDYGFFEVFGLNCN